MRADFINALLLQPAEGSMQAGDARQVERACLKFIRHEAGSVLRMAEAAGAADNERCYFVNNAFAQHKAADALRCQKSLVPRKGESVDVHFLHVDGNDAGALRTVDDEFQVMLVAEAADCRQRLQRSADIAGVRHDDGFGVGAYKLRQSV